MITEADNLQLGREARCPLSVGRNGRDDMGSQREASVNASAQEAVDQSRVGGSDVTHGA